MGAGKESEEGGRQEATPESRARWQCLDCSQWHGNGKLEIKMLIQILSKAELGSSFTNWIRFQIRVSVRITVCQKVERKAMIYGDRKYEFDLVTLTLKWNWDMTVKMLTFHCLFLKHIFTEDLLCTRCQPRD